MLMNNSALRLPILTKNPPNMLPMNAPNGTATVDTILNTSLLTLSVPKKLVQCEDELIHNW